MREATRSGVDYLHTVTELLQRQRQAHPTYGIYQAAELQFWWARPRVTDDLDQLFWFDDDGRPVAAAVLNDFSQQGSLVYSEPMLCVFTLPDASTDMITTAVERALGHAAGLGFRTVEIEVATDDVVLQQLLTERAGAMKEPAVVEAWLDIDQRQAVTDLAEGYALRSRAEMDGEHHMAHETGEAFEERLQQGSLYRADLDLLVLDPTGELAAQAMLWFDPTTSIGVVEPVRTLDEHQGRGLSRHLLTSGLERLAELGVDRVSIGWEPDNEISGHLYRSIGWVPGVATDLWSCPTAPPDI